MQFQDKFRVVHLIECLGEIKYVYPGYSYRCTVYSMEWSYEAECWSGVLEWSQILEWQMLGTVLLPGITEYSMI